MSQANSSKMEQVDRFGTGSINKIMLEFAVPAIAGIMINALYNIIDAIFLGQGVGELGLAATTVATPISLVMLALAMLVGVGGNSLAAIKFGEGKKSDAEKVLGNSLTLLCVMGVLVACIGLFAVDPLLILSGATTESMDMSRTFTQILCFGFIFQGIGMGLNNFIRTAGAPNRALGTMVIGAVVCIVLNYLFVIILGWGVAGSALATILGQAVSALTVIYYFISKKSPFSLYVRNLKIDGHIAKQILTLGLAPFALQMAAAVVNVVTNNLLVMYGAQSVVGPEGALATLGVVSKVAMFVVFPCIGVSQAAQPLLGYNYGAHNYKRVKKTFKTAMLWATVISCFFFVLVHLFPEAIIGIFGVEDNMLDFSISALQVYLFALPIIGAQLIGSNYFQATGQPIKAATLTLTRQLIFLIPLFYFMPRVLPVLFGIDPLLAVCYAPPISDILAFTTTLVFTVFEFKRLNRLEAKVQASSEDALSTKA